MYRWRGASGKNSSVTNCRRAGTPLKAKRYGHISSVPISSLNRVSDGKNRLEIHVLALKMQLRLLNELPRKCLSVRQGFTDLSDCLWDNLVHLDSKWYGIVMSGVFLVVNIYVLKCWQFALTWCQLFDPWLFPVQWKQRAWASENLWGASENTPRRTWGARSGQDLWSKTRNPKKCILGSIHTLPLKLSFHSKI